MTHQSFSFHHIHSCSCQMTLSSATSAVAMVTFTWDRRSLTAGCSGLVLQMLKALVLIIAAGLAGKMSRMDVPLKSSKDIDIGSLSDF